MPTILAQHAEAFEKAINSISGTSDEGVDMQQIAIRLLLACALGWIIGQTYRRTYTGRRYTPTLPDTNMLLCLGGALIWTVVGDNLVRAFGLAGTIGLIRYRTVVRDPKDTTILLFSMILGMACGLGQYPSAIIGGMVVILAMAFLHFSHRRDAAAQQRDANKLLNLLGEEEKTKKQNKNRKE